MPKVSFYLRNEDVPKWKAIEKKTEWAHIKLNDFKTVTTHKIKDIELQDYSRTEQSKLDKEITEQLVGGKDKLIKTETVKICSHGFPANGWSCKKRCK